MSRSLALIPCIVKSFAKSGDGRERPCHPVPKPQYPAARRSHIVGELELSQAAQQWVNVVLIWIGFGILAGLLAKTVLPGRDRVGAVATLTIGVAGSAVGLWLLSCFSANLPSGQPLNPISPLGFLAATAGAFGLLVAYRLMVAAVRKEPGSEREA